jgi:hypothetical protein
LFTQVTYYAVGFFAPERVDFAVFAYVDEDFGLCAGINCLVNYVPEEFVGVKDWYPAFLSSRISMNKFLRSMGESAY